MMSGLSLEEYELLGDSKYRAYVAAVDKTLRNFENTSEWADLISTLGKLNKVILPGLFIVRNMPLNYNGYNDNQLEW